MRKVAACLIVVLLSTSVLGCRNVEHKKTDEAQSSPSYTKKESMNGVFRYANWGDSAEAIVALEGKNYAIMDEAGIVYENIELLTYMTSVYYGFKNGEFNTGLYTITDVHTNQNLYIDDFRNINKALTEKYGEPFKDNEKWTRDLFEDDPGLALYYGDVEYLTVWTTDNLVVMHGLRADNFEIHHSIAYLDPNNTKETDTSGL